MSRFAKSLRLVGIGLGAFFVARLALLLLYPESFADLPHLDVLGAFLNGTRFDVSILLAALAPPLALMNLPIGARGKRWFDAWAWMCFAVLAVLLLVLAGDVAYFGEVERHMADELLVLGNDYEFLVGQALTSYLPGLLAVSLLVLAVAALWRRTLAVPLVEEGRRVGSFFALAIMVVLGSRGTLDSKPLGLIDAYQGGVTSYGNLSLNGAFAAVHSWRGAGVSTDYAFVSPRDAYDELGLDETPYPLLRRFDGAAPTGRNVVVMLLESWDPRYIDSYTGGAAAITPRFDAIAAQGLRFDQCYAGSQRSVDAIQALLTGVPPIAGEPSLGWGLRLARVTELGEIAVGHGYETLFVQSSKRRSYRLDSAAMSLGFEHVYGQEDIAAREGATPGNPKWGWDYDTLMFALDQMNAFESPFLGFVFTGSTHVPYTDPGERFHVRPHAESGEDAFVNMLHYSDWALGEFMDTARTQPWFDNTVFVLTGDHTFRKALGSSDLRENFRVPFVLYAPGIVRAGVDSRVCSHLDGVPTVLDLLGFSDAFSTFGESLLRKQEGFALVKQGGVMGIIARGGSVTHSLESRLEGASYGAGPEELDRLERRLLSTVQVTHELLRTNRWTPPTKDAR